METQQPYISYLVTKHNEDITSLIELLCKYIKGNQLVILHDWKRENSEDIPKLSFLNKQIDGGVICEYTHQLNNDYSAHKNYGKTLCAGKYIFQCDADEIPSEYLLKSLSDIISVNTDVELFWIPRINIFKGVTEEHAKQWGWDINNPNKWVNWNGGDYQSRLFKNLPHLKWERPLHEIVEGAKTFSKLPKEEEYALYHIKTIEKQIETNMGYNKNFSQELNKGFKI